MSIGTDALGLVVDDDVLEVDVGHAHELPSEEGTVHRVAERLGGGDARAWAEAQGGGGVVVAGRGGNVIVDEYSQLEGHAVHGTCGKEHVKPCDTNTSEHVHTNAIENKLWTDSTK